MEWRELIPSGLRPDDIPIPVIRLSGTIMPERSLSPSSLNLAGCAGILEKAFKKKRAPAVAISLNSPGGSPVQSRLIHARIRRLARKHEKKVWVFVEDLAASGGYMIALAGDEIIAEETSIVGSIGVLSAGFGFVEALQKIGVERRIHSAGEDKFMLDPFTPEKKQHVEHLKNLQSEAHRVFIEMVKQARGSKLDENEDVFTGKFWIGTRAKEIGLVDRCGNMADVIEQEYGESAKLNLIRPRRGFMSLPGFSSSSSLSASLAREIPDAIQERIEWMRYGL